PNVHALPPGWKPPAGPLEAAARWRALSAANKRIDSDAALVEVTWLCFALEQRFQDELERQLDLYYEACGARGPLSFPPDRRSRAAEAERYRLLDRSTRPVPLCR